MKSSVVKNVNLIVFFLCSLFSYSNDAVANGLPTLQLLNDSISIASRDARLFKSASDIAPSKKADISTWLDKQIPVNEVSLFGGTYWYALILDNATAHDSWVVNVSNSMIDNVDYYFYNGSERVHLKSGFKHADEFYLSYARSIELPTDQATTLLLRINSQSYGSAPIVSVAASDVYQSKHLLRLIIIIACLGALACLSVYNIFIAIGSRQTELFHYAAFLICYATGWTFMFEIPAELLQLYATQYLYIAFSLMPFFNGRFCIAFLQLDNNLPTFAKALRVIGYASALSLAVSLNYVDYAHVITSICLAFWLIAAVVAGCLRLAQGFKPAAYFVIAFFSLIVPASIILPTNLGLLAGDNINAQLYAIVGGTLDGLLLAFAIAYRMRLLADDNHKLNAELEDRVVTRTEALNKANRQLSFANDSKRRFVANVGHEIRTPMTAIIGYSDLLASDVLSATEKQRFSQIVRSSSRQLLSIVDDLLDLSKIEANKLNYHFSSTAVIELINEVKQEYRQKASEKGLEFIVDFQFPLPTHIDTDASRLKQILSNLVSNGIKFTEQGFVKVSVSVVNNTLTFSVQDSGIGITAEQASTIFTPFEQGDNSISRRYGGNGLGLNISRQLAEGIGGTLVHQSTLQQGALFILQVPCKATDQTEWLDSVQVSGVSSLPILKTAIPDLTGLKVLVADDLESNRTLIELILKSVNADVYSVDNGKKAVSYARENAVDLILLDINMPVMDGVSAVNILKQRDPQIPVIAISADAMAHQVSRFLAAGFDAHIAKPINVASFYQLLQQHLNKLLSVSQ